MCGLCHRVAFRAKEPNLDFGRESTKSPRTCLWFTLEESDSAASAGYMLSKVEVEFYNRQSAFRPACVTEWYSGPRSRISILDVSLLSLRAPACGSLWRKATAQHPQGTCCKRLKWSSTTFSLGFVRLVSQSGIQGQGAESRFWT